MSIEAFSVEGMYREMQKSLSTLMPDFEIREKAELAFEINRLKREKNALVLGHNYMEPALFISVPDIVGDSFRLASEAARSKASILVMCAVRFMAESAKILSPERTVLLPSQKAGCSLAASISAEDVRKLKSRFPGAPVVTYINVYAEVLAEADIVCTSSNAARVVRSLGDQPIIFVPDEYLARNVAQECGRQVVFSPEDLALAKAPVLIAWKGRCEVHEQFTVEDITNVRRQFPTVAVLAHPECPPEVVAASDFSGSTTRMVEYVKKSEAEQYLLLTECSMGDNIIAQNPKKNVLRLCSIRCPHMAQITLEDTLEALRHNQYEVRVPDQVAARAKLALQRMLEIG